MNSTNVQGHVQEYEYGYVSRFPCSPTDSEMALNRMFDAARPGPI